mmetsp:Transcript_12199/g.19720  ORF Transcript_12199/g.19720 Transcript_12199/m.19720 type:complete len:217 (+) Transcript_12199:143-793(+)
MEQIVRGGGGGGGGGHRTCRHLAASSLPSPLRGLRCQHLSLVVLLFENGRSLLDNVVNETVLDRLLWCEVVASVQVLINLLDGFASELGHEAHVRLLAHVDLVGADLYVDRRVERAVELGRVRHDLRMGQRVAASLLAGAEKHCRVAIALANGHGVHPGADVSHGVEDGVRLGVQAHGLTLLVDGAAGHDVHVCILVALLVVEKEELGDDELRDRR